MKRDDDQEEYLDNPTGSIDAGHECFFDGKTIRKDIKDYKEVPFKEGEPGQTEVVAETRTIDTPDVAPHELFMMFVQLNSPGAIPGCQSLVNTDEKFGGKLIRSTGAFKEVLEILEKHIDVLSQNYSVRPDWEKDKPEIYVGVKGLDFADHPGAIDPEKRAGMDS